VRRSASPSYAMGNEMSRLFLLQIGLRWDIARLRVLRAMVGILAIATERLASSIDRRLTRIASIGVLPLNSVCSDLSQHIAERDADLWGAVRPSSAELPGHTVH
jgi:hypothetical protein